MIRALHASPIGLIAFITALTLAAFAARKGLLPDDAVTLWANAISAGGGDVPIGRIVASYPTLPFFATTLLELITPAGTPAPALLAAGLLSVLAGAWFLSRVHKLYRDTRQGAEVTPLKIFLQSNEYLAILFCGLAIDAVVNLPVLTHVF